MSTHPNHRRGHGRIRGARGKPYRCRGCDRCMVPDPQRADESIAESVAGAIDDTPDPVTGDSAWRALWDEVWSDTLDETTVGAEVIRDDYSMPKGDEVSDG